MKLTLNSTTSSSPTPRTTSPNLYSQTNTYPSALPVCFACILVGSRKIKRWCSIVTIQLKGCSTALRPATPSSTGKTTTLHLDSISECGSKSQKTLDRMAAADWKEPLRLSSPNQLPSNAMPTMFWSAFVRWWDSKITMRRKPTLGTTLRGVSRMVSTHNTKELLRAKLTLSKTWDLRLDRPTPNLWLAWTQS